MPLRGPDEIDETMDVLHSSISGLLRSFMTPVWRTGRSRHNRVSRCMIDAIVRPALILAVSLEGISLDTESKRQVMALHLGMG